MNIHILLKTAEKFVVDNSPTILTAVGVVGVAGTGVLSYKAGYSQAETNYKNADETHKFELFKLNWRNYVLPIGTGAVTVGAVVGANRISASRAVALGAAYVLTQEKHEEYKAKVLEKIGKKKEEDVRTEIAQDRVNANPPPQQIIIAGDTKVPCLDLWSMTYFQSDMETIRKAMNDINIEIMNNQYASLSDFYDKLGIEPGRMSDELGWNQDSMLEISFSSVLQDDRIPVLTIDFEHVPIRGYGKCY